MSSENEPSGFLPDQLPHLVDIARLAIGRHAHHLVFALVDLEAEERGERAVQQSQRVREHHLLANLDLIAAPYAPRARHPLAHAIHRQDRRLFERRAQERAGGMRHVMLAEQDLLRRNAQLGRDLRADPQLVDHPGDHRLAKNFVRLRIGLQHAHQDAIELAERLLVEDDVVQISPP